jgi:hypothetical protein
MVRHADTANVLGTSKPRGEDDVAPVLHCRPALTTHGRDVLGAAYRSFRRDCVHRGAGSAVQCSKMTTLYLDRRPGEKQRRFRGKPNKKTGKTKEPAPFLRFTHVNQ